MIIKPLNIWRHSAYGGRYDQINFETAISLFFHYIFVSSSSSSIHVKTQRIDILHKLGVILFNATYNVNVYSKLFVGLQFPYLCALIVTRCYIEAPPT